MPWVSKRSSPASSPASYETPRPPKAERPSAWDDLYAKTVRKGPKRPEPAEGAKLCHSPSARGVLFGKEVGTTTKPAERTSADDQAFQQWQPELFGLAYRMLGSAVDAADVVAEAYPAEASELSDSLSLAFLVLLEELTPAERAAFLLHDVFGYGYPEVGRALGRAEPACRQLVARARKDSRCSATALRGGPKVGQRAGRPVLGRMCRR